jgi:hypothetical protein
VKNARKAARQGQCKTGLFQATEKRPEELHDVELGR